MRTPARLVCTFVVTAGLAGCSGVGTEPSTDGGVASPSPAVSTASPRDLLAPGDDALDMVWFSDSSGSQVASQWAGRIAEQFDVDVRVHDHAVGNLAAVEVLRSLGLEPDGQPVGDGLTWMGDLTDEVGAAEIVVVFGNPRKSGYTSDFDEGCVTTSSAPRDPPTRYAAEDFAAYGQVLDAIYEQVLRLVGDRPVVVRALDMYNPLLAPWAEAGVQAECTAAWEAWSASIAQAAGQHGVSLVSLYDAFNGPEHDQDPRELGYISPDGVHTTPQGQEAIVEAIHEAGYEPVDRS